MAALFLCGPWWPPSAFSTSPGLERYHIGYTSVPLEEQLPRHFANLRGWTARAKDWRITFSAAPPDKAFANRCEIEVKRWKSSRHINDLIGATR